MRRSFRRSVVAVAVAIKAGEQDRGADERADNAKPSPRSGDARPADRATTSYTISHLDISPSLSSVAPTAARECAALSFDAVKFNAALQMNETGEVRGNVPSPVSPHHLGRVISLFKVGV